ncbi:hypothetical protein [Aquibacillus salsiterrae]|uniref:Uncharacterized protein n=1 Tax=Aquibacillus salsiterrae TaxID=2950439 RepID=A0A9X3WCQ0_9BACI|nr:hypothetical protein [Aquibacillus salsiterrae]MDC3415560.1 hypothetical protein [Aquibacillus salsiterrae]
MENLIGIIVTIFAILSWFFGNSKMKEDENPRPVKKVDQPFQPRKKEIKQSHPTKSEGPRPAPTPSGRVYPEVDSTRSEEAKQAFEPPKKKQHESLKTNVQHESNEKNQEITIQEVNKSVGKTKTNAKQNKPTVKLNVTKHLSEQALVESVIMTEILGPPKALQRNKNRYGNRR